MDERYAVYLLASKRNGALYIGVTGDLPLRIDQHKAKAVRGFTQKYGVTTLVWFERHASILDAIAREKQLKGWNRAWKLKLIEASNPKLGGARPHRLILLPTRNASRSGSPSRHPAAERTPLVIPGRSEAEGKGIQTAASGTSSTVHWIPFPAFGRREDTVCHSGPERSGGEGNPDCGFRHVLHRRLDPLPGLRPPGMTPLVIPGRSEAEGKGIQTAA